MPETIIQSGATKSLRISVDTDGKINDPKETNFYKLISLGKTSFGVKSYPHYESITNYENKHTINISFDNAAKSRLFMTGLNHYLDAIEATEEMDGKVVKLFDEPVKSITINHDGLFNDTKSKYSYETPEGKIIMKSKAEIAGDVFTTMKKRASQEGKQMTVAKWERSRSIIKLQHPDFKHESWQEDMIGQLSDKMMEEYNNAQSLNLTATPVMKMGLYPMSTPPK